MIVIRKEQMEAYEEQEIKRFEKCMLKLTPVSFSFSYGSQ